MSQVLEIEDLWFEDGGSRIVVDAVVDDMVVVHSQTLLDPPEWGPALCRGSFDLHEEDLIPASDEGLRKLLSERIDDWAPLDTSDWDD
jgi:hypothetical protein